MAAGDLITVERIYNALNVVPGDLTPAEHSNYEAAVTEASQAVKSFVGRPFEPAGSTATDRTFEYDGSGILDIDDATSITAVTLDGGQFGPSYALDTRTWRARPFNGPPFDHITLDGRFGLVSREMGFTYNLDRYEGSLSAPLIKVTAVWGWPTIPEDVQRATVWTAIAFIENPRTVISESIEGYSRTIGPAPYDALPLRAQALLVPYTKIKV